MRRHWITALAGLSLLLQAVVGHAQPQLSAKEPVSAQQSAMPCHQESQQDAVKAPSKACCSADCSCDHACGVTALPTPQAALDDFVAAHFAALRSLQGTAPAHQQAQQRPPAAPQG